MCEIDPSDLTEVQVSGASTWHEYVNGSIFHDLAFDGVDAFDVDRQSQRRRNRLWHHDIFVGDRAG